MGCHTVDGVYGIEFRAEVDTLGCGYELRFLVNLNRKILLELD
jgi:hypothetical protein